MKTQSDEMISWGEVLLLFNVTERQKLEFFPHSQRPHFSQLPTSNFIFSFVISTGFIKLSKYIISYFLILK